MRRIIVVHHDRPRPSGKPARVAYPRQANKLKYQRNAQKGDWPCDGCWVCATRTPRDGRDKFGAINLQICLGRGGFVLVMIEGASLILVTTMAVYQDVATQRVLVFYAVAVSEGARRVHTTHQWEREQPTSGLRSRRTDLTPKVIRGVSRRSHGWVFDQIQDGESAP